MSSYRRNRSVSPPSSGIVPCFRDYQLIGDSQFLRFAEQLLDKRRKQRNGLSFLGLCVSGQKIGDLLKRVRDNFAPISRKAVVMIGTNDLLRGTTFENMRADFDALLQQLRLKGVDKMILLTIPPVPKLASEVDHWIRLSEYNKYIMRKNNGKNIIVVNAYAKFVLPRAKNLTPKGRRCAEEEGSPETMPTLCKEKPTSILRQSTGMTGAIFASDGSVSPTSSLKGAMRVSIDEESHGRRVYLLSQKTEMEMKEQEPEDSDDSSSSSPRLLPRIRDSDQVVVAVKCHRANSSSSGAVDEDDDASQRTLTSKRRAYSMAASDSGGGRASRKRSYSLAMLSSRRDDLTSAKRRRSALQFTGDANRDQSSSSSSDRGEVALYADHIFLEYFEKFFWGGQNRKDLIHLNNKGLCIIQELILAAID